jgi:site-specific recombinase XerC
MSFRRLAVRIVAPLTPTHVRTLANKAADGLRARSVQIIHSTLRTMLSDAMREELIERNVTTVVRPPSVERVEIQPWSTERRADSSPPAPITACTRCSRSVSHRA